MTTRSYRWELLAMLLAVCCCQPLIAQDRYRVVIQPEPSARPGPPTGIPRHSCPSLEELGYQFRHVADISLDIRLLEPVMPADCSVNLFAPAYPGNIPARPMATEFSWAASELYHQPLYFEDAILERSGQAQHPLLQPWLSGAHFFGMFPIMPYLIGLDRTHDHVYTLGYYRPGTPTPCLGRRLPPLELDAAAFETTAWLGLIFLLP